MRARASIPARAAVAIATLHAARIALERRHLRALSKALAQLEVEARRAVQSAGAGEWTLTKHARAMATLRPLGRAFGREVSRAARDAAQQASELGAEQYLRKLTLLASAELGVRIRRPLLDIAEAARLAAEHVAVRTDDVGARAGEDVGQAGVAVSYLASQDPGPPDALKVGALVAAAAALRARSSAERVIVTEITAGEGIGGDAVHLQVVRRYPKMQRYWDATLDRRVCATCAELHHLVVAEGESFPGGLDDAPAHPRCRCCVGPWAQDWAEMVEVLDIAPGPRTGIQELAETRLPSFSAFAS